MMTDKKPAGDAGKAPGSGAPKPKRVNGVTPIKPQPSGVKPAGDGGKTATDPAQKKDDKKE